MSLTRRAAQALPTLALALALLTSCAGPRPAATGGYSPNVEAVAFLDSLQRHTFDFFWETTNPSNGLVPDRWPTPSFSSVAAVGSGLTAYPIGVERGWITREQAAGRTLTTLRFLWNAPQGPEARGNSGYKGHFYHFLDMQTGERFATNELSNIDTALLIAGVLTAAEYFDGEGSSEVEIRSLADSLYRRVEWPYLMTDRPVLSMGWHPETGFIKSYWTGYNEAMLLYVLALGSPTHPLEPSVWKAFTDTYLWEPFYGYEHLNFAPLFGHQYSHLWIDLRGIQDDYMRSKGIDYFENSRRAVYAQRAYAIDNPNDWAEYGPNLWGLTASDGPKDTTLVIDGRPRTFHTYWARGAANDEINDDGTLVPTAACGSVPFAPEITIPALQEMKRRYGSNLYGQYGFLDAFNPTLKQPIRLQHGRVVPGVGWFDGDYLGIDQGPILAMIENYRTGLIWDLLRENPYIVRGLCRAGFTGGWIEGKCGE